MSAAAPIARRVLPEYAMFDHGISEFFAGFNGTCTETALEVCLAAADHRAPTQAHAADITRAMIARAEASANGATTLKNIAAEARSLGYRTILEWDYQEPLSGDWIAICRAHAGIHPILMQVAQGHNLKDAETGVAPEAAAHGLRYHAIAIVGKQSDGYIVADGDHPQINTRFQIYPYQPTLVAAVPCGLMVLDMPASILPPTDEDAQLKADLATANAAIAALQKKLAAVAAAIK